MMKIRIKNTRSDFQMNTTYQVESLTQKLRRITGNNEAIKAEVPVVYTEKKDGVMPAYDIRSDRFEIAREAVEKMQKAADVSRELKGADIQAVEVKKEG